VTTRSAPAAKALTESGQPDAKGTLFSVSSSDLEVIQGGEKQNEALRETWSYYRLSKANLP
jgi:hypothetical protein